VLIVASSSLTFAACQTKIQDDLLSFIMTDFNIKDDERTKIFQRSDTNY